MNNNNLFKTQRDLLSMRNVTLLITFAFVFILLVGNASAVQFWKYDGKRLDNNVSSYKYGVINYNTFDVTSTVFNPAPPWWSFIGVPLGIPPNTFIDSLYPSYNSDTLETSKPLEIEVIYNFYPDLWNTRTSNNTISYCSLTIKYSTKIANSTVVLYQANFTDSISNAKYFVKLNKGDDFTVNEECYFNSPSERILDIPADFTIVAPTWNCQACQFYNWQKDQVRLTKAVTLSDYSTTIIGYMKAILTIFFEFFTYAYWTFLILLLLFGVSLIFIGIFFIWSYLSKVIR